MSKHCQLSPGANPSAAEDPCYRTRNYTHPWFCGSHLTSSIQLLSKFLNFSGPTVPLAKWRKPWSCHYTEEMNKYTFSVHHSVMLAVVTSLSSSKQSIITRRKFSFKTYYPCTLPLFNQHHLCPSLSCFVLCCLWIRFPSHLPEIFQTCLKPCLLTRVG